MRKTKFMFSALALVAIGGGISACSPVLAAQQPADPRATAPASAATDAGSGGGSGAAITSGSGAGVSTGPGRYILQSMPAGTVWLGRGADGHLQARVDVFGLTPGSSHQVSIDGPAGHPVQFPVLTANSAGQADTTLTSVDRVARLPHASRFVIRLGDAAGDPLAAEPIAESSVLPARPGPGAVFSFHAVTFDTNGVSLGQPAGRATITYDASAGTLAVTVTASGLNPGPHAAHIHLGSCQDQGAVKYMLADFVADANGDIINQTRVVTGVTSVPGPGNWYLNLHQGGMNQILANGVPTLSFRPMLCTDITSFARAMGTPTSSPSSTPIAQPTHY
jgi:CHRD domain-containing protein